MRVEQVGDGGWKRVDQRVHPRRVLLAPPSELVGDDLWRSLPFYPDWREVAFMERLGSFDRPLLVEIARSPHGAMLAGIRDLPAHAEAERQEREEQRRRRRAAWRLWCPW